MPERSPTSAWRFSSFLKKSAPSARLGNRPSAPVSFSRRNSPKRVTPVMRAYSPFTDFAAIAGAYGGHGVRVQDRGELEAACRSALGRSTFTLIEAVVDKAEYAQQM